MPTVKGNGPNFTFLTIFLLVPPLAVLLSLRAAHSSTAGERLQLWMVYITLTPAALTGHFLLLHHPNCISHKDTTANWRGAQDGQKGDFRTIPVLHSLYIVQCFMFLNCSTIPPNTTLPSPMASQ